MTDTLLTFDMVQVGATYSREQVAGLVGVTPTTLSRKRWRDRITPLELGAGRVRYPGERIIAYFAALGWEKPAPRRPMSPARIRRRVVASTARALAAV